MINTMKHNSAGYIYGAFAALLWGSTAAVVKLLGIGLNSPQILFYSSAIATASLFCIALWQKKIGVVRTYKTKDFLKFAYMSFLGVFLYYILLFTALQRAPGQEAFIVNYTWPIWVVVFAAIILRERFNFRKALAVVMGFVGVLFVITKGDITSFDISAVDGNILALSAAVSYGLFSALSKLHDYEKVTSTMFYYGFSFIYVTLFIIFFSELHTPTLKESVGLLWLGVFTGGLAFVSWQLALKHGDTGKMSNLIFITPFLSLIYLYVLTGEKVLLSSIVGALIIVSGIVIQSYRKKMPEEKIAP